MFKVDEIKLEEALHKRASDPGFDPGKYYSGADGLAHIAPMQKKVRQYAKAYLHMLDALPGREVDYDYAVDAALRYIADERAGAHTITTTGFQEEFPHTALVYLVEAARLYPAHAGEVEVLLKLATDELSARAAAV